MVCLVPQALSRANKSGTTYHKMHIAGKRIRDAYACTQAELTVRPLRLCWPGPRVSSRAGVLGRAHPVYFLTSTLIGPSSIALVFPRKRIRLTIALPCSFFRVAMQLRVAGLSNGAQTPSARATSRRPS